MEIFGKSMKEIKGYIIEIVEKAVEIVELQEEYFRAYFESDKDSVKKIVKKIGDIESEADRIKREFEMKLYSGAGLPFTRGDKMILVERIEEITDVVEQITYHLYIERFAIPEIVHEEILELVTYARRCVEMLKECVEAMFVDMDKAIEYAHEIENMEERLDDIEHTVIKELFKKRDEINCVDLILTRKLVMGISTIGNYAEDASDIVTVIISKRKS